MTRNIKILDVVPVILTEMSRLEYRKELFREIRNATNGLVSIDVIYLEKGVASIESAYDEYVSAPYILEKVVWAEENSYDAVIIDCFGDPALDAARELVRIPVVGPNQASTHLAALIASRFSIINILRETENLVRSLVTKYGLVNHLASIENIEMPVLDLRKDPDKLLEKIVESAKRAFNEHSANAVVLGCTGMSFVADMAEERLRSIGIEMPVIDPLRTAIHTAVSLVLLGKSHSKLAYSRPRRKHRVADFKIV
ncbi:MAG: aspartate/glutamate racemase family protein [Desulfurococcaceae archaeon]